MAEILRVEDLTKYFATKKGTLHAVDGVTFGLREANLYCWGSGESCWQYVDAEYFEVYAGRRHLREARRGACFGR